MIIYLPRDARMEGMLNSSLIWDIISAIKFALVLSHLTLIPKKELAISQQKR